MVQKYQMARRWQLWQEWAAAQARPRLPAELRDPGARAEFIGRIAAPIAKKSVE